MIKNLALISGLLLTLNFMAQDFVATYSLAGVSPSSGVIDPSPMPAVPGLDFKPLQAIGVSANSSASGRFSFSDWPLGGIDGSDTYSLFTGGLSGSSYYECKILVAPGSTLSLQSVEFAMRRSSTGIRNFSVRCDRNNFSSDLAASTGTNTRLSVLPVNVFFWKYDSVAASSDQRGVAVSLGSLGNTITDSITFRIYAWNAESSGGNFSVDNLSFTGHVVDSLLLSGIEDVPRRPALIMFPNPCSGERIYFSDQIAELIIYDSAGGIVVRQTEPCTSCDVSLLAEGIYMAQSGFRWQKFIINR